MRRKNNKLNQWLVVTFLVAFMFCGSFFLKQNQRKVYNHDHQHVKTTPQTTVPSFSLAPLRHVTKSLAELGKMDEINRHVLFFNEVSNCGAEVLVFLLQKMQGFNNYRHVRLKRGSETALTRIEEEELVDNVYEVMRDEAVPLSFDQNVHFVNFTSFDKQSPTFINLIREPADRILSRSSRKQGSLHDGITKCRGESECVLGEIRDGLSIPYFCGHTTRCDVAGSQWALQMAKANVEKYYPVVGVLEELNATLEVLENKVPYFFKGVQSVYKNSVIDKFNHKKKTKIKKTKIHKRLKEILQTEYDFYDWVKMRLFQQLQLIYGEHRPH